MGGGGRVRGRGGGQAAPNSALSAPLRETPLSDMLGKSGEGQWKGASTAGSRASVNRAESAEAAERGERGAGRI